MKILYKASDRVLGRSMDGWVGVWMGIGMDGETGKSVD